MSVFKGAVHSSVALVLQIITHRYALCTFKHVLCTLYYGFPQVITVFYALQFYFACAPTQKEQVKLKTESIKQYFPKNYTAKQMEQVIMKLLAEWQLKREKAARSRDAR